MHSKKCTSCGNDNDPLLTNCLFCKSPLPVIDPNSLSNEALVLNAGQWIGKLKDGFYVIKSENPNSWTGSITKGVYKAEIQGCALQYLSLIQVRVISNINLNSVYQDLKKEYDIGVAMDDITTRKLKGVKKAMMWFGIFIVLLIALMIIYSKK
jgi:hypothetical protein